MVYCSNCGEKNDDKSKFCKNCGEILKSEENYTVKPIKSRIKYIRDDDLRDKDYYEKEYGDFKEEVSGIIEWDVVLAAALILIILAGILVRILAQISVWIAVFMALIYVVIFTRRKFTLIISLPLTLIIAGAIYGFFSL